MSQSIALLDIQLGDKESFPMARKLAKRSIPFLFVSARCGSGDIPPDMRHVPFLPKPLDQAALRLTLMRTLSV